MACGSGCRASTADHNVQRRAILVVLDGVGCGTARDAAAYGDAHSDTLGNLAQALGGLSLPNLEALGLGTIAPIQGLRDDGVFTGARCAMQPVAKGKDSTTGHWELCGVAIEQPFPTYPEGFPAPVLDAFSKATGRPVIGNVVGSGTEIIQAFGERHVASGAWIVYTSADSVFQLAAHEDVVPVEELYRACAAARALFVAPNNVSRVIARPFVGTPGAFVRTTRRRDFSVEPPRETLLDALVTKGVDRFGVGKVDDLFAHRSISSKHTLSNADGLGEIEDWLRSRQNGGLLFANLVDFDQLYGHRNDSAGFYRALQEFDDALPRLIAHLREGDLLAITADHGNDPTTASTDHSRERVPALLVGPAVQPVRLAERSTFADLGATIAEWLGSDFRGDGTSFLPLITQ